MTEPAPAPAPAQAPAQDRKYGFAIGSAIADAMGAYVSYSPEATVATPFDTLQNGINPGYWTEPTAIWLAVVKGEDPGSGPTGIYDRNKVARHALYASLVRAGAYAVIYYNDFGTMLQMANSTGGPMAKLWAAILVTALHGGHKRTILNPISYGNLELPQEIKDILSDPDPNLGGLGEVLSAFGSTDNYAMGLRKIVNTSMCPEWTAPLYGQLAGAYYGLTDIPETWMDCVQSGDVILDAIDSLVVS